jgi:hypothetical protein
MNLRAYSTFKLTLIALCSVAGFAGVRYYAWIPLSIVLGVAALSVMRRPSNRRLLVGAFVAIGLFSLIIGRVYFNGVGLDENGIFSMLLFALLPAGIVSFCVYSSEKPVVGEDGPLA